MCTLLGSEAATEINLPRFKSNPSVFFCSAHALQKQKGYFNPAKTSQLRLSLTLYTVTGGWARRHTRNVKSKRGRNLTSIRPNWRALWCYRIKVKFHGDFMRCNRGYQSMIKNSPCLTQRTFLQAHEWKYLPTIPWQWKIVPQLNPLWNPKKG